MTPPLPRDAVVGDAWRRRLERVFESTRRAPPSDLAGVTRGDLGIDLSTRYGGTLVRHPFGKASGQLSCTMPEVEADLDAGIAFIVLKTVIAEDETGRRSMEAWATPDTKMVVEPISSRAGAEGWTVTWMGRGWAGDLAAYCKFFRASLAAGCAADIPIVPSVKFHLPSTLDEPFHADEYQHTMLRLADVWQREGCGGPMLLEKDLSPTLAGDERASQQATILRWLREVPRLIEQTAPAPPLLGVKVMNALFDDAFQLEMLRALAEDVHPRPAFLVAFNRLFDPARRLAYGGYDLSDRNLRVLDAFWAQRPPESAVPALSATGNICSGRMMLEYARRGCENGQLHTFFQLPLTAYGATGGKRTARALHTLMLDPREGLAVWLRHLHETGLLDARDGLLHFSDVVAHARSA